jgi:hypothetical protein
VVECRIGWIPLLVRHSLAWIDLALVRDVEADWDLYAAGSRRCLLSCNDTGQQRPFIFSMGGKRLFATDSRFLAMDGAAAGSGGSDYSPYSHGRHDAEKRKLGVSIQWDLVGIADTGTDASVPGRGALKAQAVTRFFAEGARLLDSCERNAAAAAMPHLHATAAEQMQRRFADASSAAGGDEPSSVEHCYMCMSSETAVGRNGTPKWFWWPPTKGPNAGPGPHRRLCSSCQRALADDRVKLESRASKCGCSKCS